jgi:hypothetical protein
MPDVHDFDIDIPLSHAAENQDPVGGEFDLDIMHSGSAQMVQPEFCIFTVTGSPTCKVAGTCDNTCGVTCANTCEALATCGNTCEVLATCGNTCGVWPFGCGANSENCTGDCTGTCYDDVCGQ